MQETSVVPTEDCPEPFWEDRVASDKSINQRRSDLRTRQRRFIKRGLIVALAAASLVLGTVPASAEVLAGAGAGTGGDYPEGVELDTCSPPAENFLTASVEGYELVIDHQGSYTGTDEDSSAPVSYVGATRVTVTAGPHHISPLGTHTAACQVEPEEIPVDVEVNGSDDGGKVECNGEGTMLRVQSAVVIQFTGGCELIGNVPLADGDAGESDMDHTLEGALVPCLEVDTPPQEDPDQPGDNVNPCDNVPVPEPDPGSIYSGTYEAVPAQ